MAALPVDSTAGSGSAPNRVPRLHERRRQQLALRDALHSQTFVNNTGASVTRLRFKILDLDTFPAASGFADLRPRTSSAVVVAGINDTGTCAATGAPSTPPCTATVQGSSLEQASPPNTQFNGGGFNSSFGAGTVTLGTPLANGASVNLQFLVGIQQIGNFRMYLNVEALP